MSKQRQAGFIKNYSAKNIQHSLAFQQEPSQFSYFRPRPSRDDAEQFSPYKIEDVDVPKRVDAVRPPLPLPRNKSRQALQSVQVREMKAQGEQVHARLKQKLVIFEQQRKDKSKEKLQENIGNIRNRIEQLNLELQELKNNKSFEKIRLQAKVQKEIEAELQSSSSSDSEEVVVNSIPSPKMSIERPNQRRSAIQTQQNINKQPTLRQSNERSNPHSQRQNIVTFNSRTSNHPPLQIRDYSSSEDQVEHNQKREPQQPEQEYEEEEEEDSHYLVERGRETVSKPIQKQQAPPQRQAKGIYKNKGGVCFDIDTKQFTESIPQPRQQPRPQKKPTKVDKRSQILRRRETAKAYDRKARKALFTAYN